MHTARWVLCVSLVVAGCGDAAGPAVPKEDFSFKVQNEIQQAGANPANAQVAVRFSVSVPGDVPSADLAKIQEIDVLWPNNYVRTPILSGFQADGDSLTATRLLADRTDGLVEGSYTLEVQFTDGKQVTDQQYCDGRLLDPPTIDVLVADSAGVSIRWHAPSGFHYWSLYLERLQPAPATVLLTAVSGSASGGSMGAGFDYDFQPDETYALVMDLENTCNHREIRFPVP